MTTSTLTVTDFVLARIAEDEAAARVATTFPWRHERGQGRVQAWREDGLVSQPTPYRVAGQVTGWDGPHIARHDPARVLAQCAAMRKIVEVHHSFHVTTRNDGLNWNYRGCSECNEPEDWEPAQGDYWPCGTILALASIWSDHPQFNPDWS